MRGTLVTFPKHKKNPTLTSIYNLQFKLPTFLNIVALVHSPMAKTGLNKIVLKKSFFNMHF